MITINNLSKSYGKKILFENISLGINRREKIGLIGPNGSGKSTLFHLIMQDIEPSSGNIKVNKNIRIGYLPQESSFKSAHTVLSEIIEADELIRRLKKEKDELESRNETASERYGKVEVELETLGYFSLEHRAKKILMGLGFKERDFNRPINQMSGGWQMRVLLAKLLVHSYDLLLLDEPTNYLDLNAALWLKDFLVGFDATFILISHDRAFLTEVTNYTLVLENGKLTKVCGNYEHYLEVREENRRFLIKQFKEQEKKKEQLQIFVARFHAQPNKAAAVRAKRRVLERIEEQAIVLPPDPKESIRAFHFPAAAPSGHLVMKLEGVSKAYADTQVYKDFDFEVVQGERAVLAGENGAGKSTLLKILAGVVDIDSGVRTVGYRAGIGYFSQARLDVLNPDNTVLREAYSAALGYTSETVIRTVLGAFLFTGDDVDKKVGVLSGGEKSRLILAKLLINPPNFLLLDEPTTHLDVDAVDALVKALTEYEGTIVFISHDIHFVRSVANVVFEVKNGRVRKFSGNFDYYLQKREQPEVYIEPARARVKAKEPVPDKKQEERAARENMLKDREEKRRVFNEAIQKKIDKLKKEKDRLHLERYAKTRALANQHIYRDEETIEKYKARLKYVEERTRQINDATKLLKKSLK